MDALSVAASVAGLLQASDRVICLLSGMVDAPSTVRDVLTEVHALKAILRRLNGFVLAPSQQSTARKSRIQLCDLVITLTDCVNTFSELDVELGGLGVAGTGGVTLTAWERVKDKDIAKILKHLQMHKASLGLMLSIYSWFVYHFAFFPHSLRASLSLLLRR